MTIMDLHLYILAYIDVTC